MAFSFPYPYMKKFRKYLAMIPGSIGLGLIWCGGSLVWLGAKIEGGLLIDYKSFMKVLMKEGL